MSRLCCLGFRECKSGGLPFAVDLDCQNGSIGPIVGVSDTQVQHLVLHTSRSVCEGWQIPWSRPPFSYRRVRMFFNGPKVSSHA